MFLIWYCLRRYSVYVTYSSEMQIRTLSLTSTCEASGRTAYSPDLREYRQPRGIGDLAKTSPCCENLEWKGICHLIADMIDWATSSFRETGSQLRNPSAIPVSVKPGNTRRICLFNSGFSSFRVLMNWYRAAFDAA